MEMKYIELWGGGGVPGTNSGLTNVYSVLIFWKTLQN